MQSFWIKHLFIKINFVMQPDRNNVIHHFANYVYASQLDNNMAMAIIIQTALQRCQSVKIAIIK